MKATLLVIPLKVCSFYDFYNQKSLGEKSSFQLFMRINMNKIINKFFDEVSPLFFIGVLLVSSLALNAQDSEVEVEEIVVKGKVLYSDQVNALKTPVPVLDVPQTVSIVTDEDIRKQGFRQIGDIVRYTPGVNTSQGEGHRDAVVFRGVRSTADFFQDGVRDDVQYYRSLYNVEQVEILRGPNALLLEEVEQAVLLTE